MGTIALKINKLNETKEKLKQELLFKGFTEEEIGPEFSKMANCIKTIGNTNLPQWFKDSIVCWYDPKRLRMTNEEMLALKEAGKPLKLIDFSGNGLDMDLKNFSWGYMSGIGGYPVNFDNHYFFTLNASGNKSTYSLHLTNIKNAGLDILGNWGTKLPEVPPFRIKISGITLQSIIYKYYKNNKIQFIYLNKNGIHQLPGTDKYLGDKASSNFAFGISQFTGPCDINIEILLEYQNALVFDGVDDFAGPIEIPKLGEEFTVLSKQQILKNSGYGFAFTLYFRKNYTENWSRLLTLFKEREIIPNIRGYIRNNDIYKVITSNAKIDDSRHLGIPPNVFSLNGCLREDNVPTEFSLIAFYNCLIFNKELTPEQIEWVKTNIVDPVDKLEFQSEYQNN